MGENSERPERAPAAGLAPPLLTEMLGAFAITFVDAGGAAIASLGYDVSLAARSVAAGLTVMVFIYATGDVSGAHFNPAVTFAFALRRVFPWTRVPAYCAAQLGGALIGAALLRALFGQAVRAGVTAPADSVFTALMMEAILSFLLVTVVLCTSLRSKVLGPNAAIAAGGTVALANLFAKPISGASMNPARSLGVAVVAGHLDHMWVYIVGPLVGAILGVAVMFVVHRHRRAEERLAAIGEKWP